MPPSNLHKVLLDLKLDSFGNSGSQNSTLPLQILDHLLKSKILPDEAIRAAHSAVSSSNRKPPPPPPTTSIEHKRTRHVALRIYYHGEKYAGLAENVGQLSDNSIEKALFAALQKAQLIESRFSCGYSRCGRTDRGVSAAGQVVAFRLRSAFSTQISLDKEGTELLQEDNLPSNSFDKIKVWVIPRDKKNICNSNSGGRVERELSELAYEKIVNNLLPQDIRVLGWCPVSEEFSARFSAMNRTYRYFFVPRTLSLQLVREGLERLVGKHDFRNFCKMDVEKVYNFERQIHSAELIEGLNGVCYLEIVGQAFLWHQIRCIAHVLFLVGGGLEEPSVITELLDVERNPRKPNYPLANEHPLVLHACDYQNLRLGYSVQNLWSIQCGEERKWEDSVLAAARVRNLTESLLNAQVLVDELAAFVEYKVRKRKQKRQAFKDGVSKPLFESKYVTWGMALEWMNGLGIVPGPDDVAETAYTPLLERSRGPSYEEKLASLLLSSRKDRYEQNVVKKRKTREEDTAFYEHKVRQGGSSS